MAYRAEIEIGVKGADKLAAFQKTLKETNKILEITNKTRDIFEMPLQNVQNYTKTLREAARALQIVEIGTKEETTAIRNYVQAAAEAATVRDRQNKLMDEEAQKLGLLSQKLREYNAAAAPPRQTGGSLAGRYLRPGSAVSRTQFGAPIGPEPGVQFGSATQFGPVGGPSSSVLGGQSSFVAGRVQRLVDVKKDQRTLDQALLDLEKKSAAELNKKVQLQQSLVEGTREVLELAQRARRQQEFRAGVSGTAAAGPLAGPGSLGFPVALPGLSEAELKGLRNAKQKLEIINRTVRRRKELVGLAANLQRLEVRGKVAIADTNRQKEESLEITKRELDFEQRLNNVLAKRRKQQADLAKERKRRSERFSEDLLLGAGFPLLFGGGAGAVGGGILGAIAGQGKGGFGAQIFFSAVGSQLDALAQQAQELGKALDPLTADVDKVIEAAGTAGQVSGKVAKELEELGFEQRALEIATEDLARVVGSDGVEALREFNDSTSELNRALNRLVLDIQVYIAKILTAAANFSGTPQQREIRQARETARGLIGAGQGTPELEAAFKKATSSLDVSGAFGAITEAERTLLREVQRIEQERDKKLKTELEKAEEKSVTKKDTNARFDLQIEKERNKIIELGNDLTNERVFAAERAIIFQEAAARLSEKGLSADREAQIRLERTNKLQELSNKRTKLINDNKQKAGKAAEKTAREVLRLERAAASEKLRQVKLEQSIQLVGLDQLSQVRAELKSLNDREVLERAFIISSTEDVKLQDEKLKTLALQFDLREAQLKQTEKELIAQRKINALKAEQEVGGLRRDLQQELQGLALPTGDRIDDAFINLQRQQEARRTNEITAINEAIAVQEKLNATGLISNEVAEAEIQKLRAKKAAYEELLPQISEAEKRQLVYNETLAAVQGPINSLVFGLRDVVGGTKTAQEAFADFLKVIADQFFTIAARMIAQYIAIGNARNFAFGGAAGGGGGGAVGGILGLLFGGSFADGGRPPVGKASLVGERGPELFVPSRSGTIIPNDQLGGSSNTVTVNVDAKGTEVSGNSDQSRQLGTAISRAVQAELVKQQRPGGVLHSSR